MRGYLRKVRLHIDVGFGDVVSPGIEQISYPALLDFPPPLIRAYPKESVVAEKLHAMVLLGLANSRMKDFYDVLLILRQFDLEGSAIMNAISRTFERRGTNVPVAIPYPLTDAFSAEPDKQRQWNAFIAKNDLVGVPASFSDVVRELREQIGWCFLKNASRI